MDSLIGHAWIMRWRQIELNAHAGEWRAGSWYTGGWTLEISDVKEAAVFACYEDEAETAGIIV